MTLLPRRCNPWRWSPPPRDGSWSATLPFALAQSQGVRTTSTTAQSNTISGMSAGTTTGLSRLYGVKYQVFLPLVLR